MVEETGIGSFTDAVNKALEEMDEGTSEPEEQVVKPDEVDQAEEKSDDQAESESEAVESVFGDQSILDDLSPSNENPMDQTIELEGFDDPVSVRELADGYLRQADYTRKTQELADRRESFDEDTETAAMLMQRLREAPAETVAALAVEVGLLEADQIPADLKSESVVKFPSQEEVDAQVKAMVEDALSEHPAVREANDMVLRQQIGQEFAEIEEQIGQPLSVADRQMILEKAVELETTRLDAAFATLMREADMKRKQREDVSAAAPARSGGGESSEAGNDDVEKATSVRGLFDQVEQGLIT